MTVSLRNKVACLLIDEKSRTAQCLIPALELTPKKEAAAFIPDDYIARFDHKRVAGDIQASAVNGLRMAANLLFREGHYRRQFDAHFDKLNLPDEALNAINGRSTDLAFALAVLAMVRGLPQPMAATGVLYDNGEIGAVSGVPEKLKAAAHAMPQGCWLFYPEANDKELTGEDRQVLSQHGCQLKPVTSLEKAALELGIPVKTIWKSAPYKGLKVFEVNDKSIFFGRNGDSARAVEKLKARAMEGQPSIIVVAESGVGKSSFVRAGIIATLDNDYKKQNQPVVFDSYVFDAEEEKAVCRRMVQGVPQQLTPSTPCPESFESLTQWLLSLELGGAQLVMVFDQFEQIFSGKHSADLITRFARLLETLQQAGVWIIACMRSEFYAAYTQVKDKYCRPILLDVFGESPSGQSGVFDLRPLNPALLRNVVQGPADLAGVRFGETPNGANLVDRIIADVGQQTDALPLLEFLLERLYESKEPSSSTITFENYEQMGGLAGALGRAAEEAVEGHPDEVVNVVLRSLVQLDANDKDLVLASSVDITELPEQSTENYIIQALEAARLVSVGAYDEERERVSVRLVHEALIRTWPRAEELFKNKDTLKLIRDRDQLKQSACRWLDEDCQAALLPTDSAEIKRYLQLQQRLGILELGSEIQAYLIKVQINDSLLREKQEEQLRQKLVDHESALIETFRKLSDSKSDLSPADRLLEEVRFGLRAPLYDSYEGGIIYQGKKFSINDQILLQYQDVVNLLLQTESMDVDEKQYWISVLRFMKKDQVDRFIKTLRNEYNSREDVDGYCVEISEVLTRVVFDGKVAIDAYTLNGAINYFDIGRKSGVLSDLEYISLLKKLESKVSASNRLSRNIFRQYEKILSALYVNITLYRDKLNFSFRHLDVITAAREHGIVSDYDLSDVYLRASWYALFAGEYSLVEQFSREGLERTPRYQLLETNLAHALALQGQKEKAVDIYKANYGIELEHSHTQRDRWETLILKDFDDLEEAGITSPVFDEIRQFFESQEVD